MLNYLYLIVLGVVASFWGYYAFRVRHLKNKLVQSEKSLQKAREQTQVLTIQRQNYQEKQKNESTSHNLKRSELVERMQQSGDLRD